MPAYLELKNLLSFGNPSDETKLQISYRVISFLVTSGFYLYVENDQSMAMKAFFILCIASSAAILTYLYVKNCESKGNTRTLVIFETIANSLILIPSGGLSSPYIWYALNTMLISSLKLGKSDCWINLVIYFACSGGISYFVSDERGIGLIEFIRGESYLIISFTLIAMLLQMLNTMIKRVKHEKKKTALKNRELVRANKRIRESMEHMMSFYQAVHSFINYRNEGELGRMLAYYTRMVAKSKTAFFLRTSRTGDENALAVEDGGAGSFFPADDLKRILSGKLIGEGKGAGQREFSVGGRVFAVISVKSINMEYGILGIEIADGVEEGKDCEECDRLVLMAELGTIVFEKAYMEKMNEGLLLNEEQNRIANEMHDSVLQRLFGISSGIFALIKRIEDMELGEIQSELNLFRNSIDNAMKEMRSTIYDNSWARNGRDLFEEKMESYINEVRLMNNVEIEYEVDGRHEMLPYRYKKVFYRIMSEVVSNALHHGKASFIRINLEIKAESIALRISDNGVGFKLEEIRKKKRGGIGIRNICCLAESLNGRTTIDSEIGKGTTIETVVPNVLNLTREGEAV